ncbi:hypothetical protein F3J23_14655 [Chryseobacterium sp. Tr-659]|uniref:hypothetical protein n=1 Tax=Chryseobacterium sp. Tr-659 TaxID=2608340 RepID=UPI00141ED193|nr:hypothetical protein [Chryseobacterium sp. Tr-659]NIF06688.1 hypothetical protein [Chryseobacterium sp. Tr-659]
MAKYITYFILLLWSNLYRSQIGINTANPQTMFHIDGKKDNPKTGVPTTIQQANDIVFTSSGSMGIGTILPDSSAVMHLKSENKGVLLPKISLQSKTDKQTITKPANGLLIYNINNSLQGGTGMYYNSGTSDTPAWYKVASTNDIPEYNSYSLTSLRSFNINDAVTRVYSYSQLIGNCNISAHPNECIPPTTTQFDYSYRITFNKNKIGTDKYAILSFDYKISTATIDNAIINNGNWLVYDIEFNINNNIVSTYADVVFDIPQASSGVKDAGKFYIIDLSNTALNSSNNVLEIIIKPKRSIFKTNAGNFAGNYSINEKKLLNIKIKDFSFQLFEK